MITISQDAVFVMLISPQRFADEVKLFKSAPRGAQLPRLKLIARKTHTPSLLARKRPAARCRWLLRRLLESWREPEAASLSADHAVEAQV
jgi:hypothetical protein